MSYHPGVDVHHVRGIAHLRQWNRAGDRKANAAIENPKDPHYERDTSSTPIALAEYRRLVQLTKDPAEAAQRQNDK